MLVTKHLCCVCAFLVSAIVTWGQDAPQFKNVKPPIRLLFTAHVGDSVNLGYFFVSKSFGTAIEIPIDRRFELQAGTLYSPDRRVLTSRSNELSAGGATIFWPTHRFGISGKYDYDWLWTPQFDRAGWRLGPGAVFRDNYWGRTYVSYEIVRGCVWGIPSNPCRILSDQTRGVDIKQEFGITTHLRMGLGGSILHFCDESVPTVAGTCHYGVSEYLSFAWEFPKRSGDELY
jgi:hypothetical protein